MGDPNAVAVAYVCGNSVIYSWHKCMVELLAYDSAANERVMRGGFIATRFGTDGLSEARNKTVRTFLEEDNADWLWWVDTDMGFAPDTVDRLLAAADPETAPIVGGLCFSNREDNPDDLGGYRTTFTPTVFDWVNVDGRYGWAVRWNYAPNTMTQVGGTGAACVLIHKSVFEKIEAEHGRVWYDRVPNTTTGQLIGEDLSFCLRAGALGIPMYVHTGVPTTHFKHLWLGEEDYVRQRFVEAAVDNPVGSSLPIHVDVEASLETLAQNRHAKPDGMLKLDEDLERYRQIIEATKPEVIVETGTRAGGSARWFAELGLEVITVDIEPAPTNKAPGVKYVRGDAADPEIAEFVTRIVAGRRCMVSLDSDHSGPHVTKEIELYGPLVTPGCYLVVEDGIFGYATRTLRTAHGLGDMVGSPLDAIEKHLEGNPDWSRDIATERLSPVTHHPSGWWVRNG